MPRAAKAQMRILKIAELLSTDSSPTAPVRSSDILRFLEKQGMCITRATLKNDIASLCECGFKIKKTTLSTGECYYIESEPQSLQDCVIELIKDALNKRQSVCISITGYPGEYTVSPYALLRNADGYHAVCYSQPHRRVILLPVNKILSAHAAESEFIQPPADYCLAYYIGRGFELCQSASETITLSFTDDAVSQVRARFGDSVQVRRDQSGLMRADVSTEVGASLFSWVFLLGGRVRIVSPGYVCGEYKNILRTQLSAY